MSRGPGPVGPLRSPQGLDLDAERERIRRQIEQLERSLQPGGAEVQLAVCDSSLISGTGSGSSGRSPGGRRYRRFARSLYTQIPPAVKPRGLSGAHEPPCEPQYPPALPRLLKRIFRRQEESVTAGAERLHPPVFAPSGPGERLPQTRTTKPGWCPGAAPARFVFLMFTWEPLVCRTIQLCCSYPELLFFPSSRTTTAKP